MRAVLLAPGNGMILDDYSWTQQLSDLQVVVPVPDGIKGKDLVVDIKSKKLKVRGAEVANL